MVSAEFLKRVSAASGKKKKGIKTRKRSRLLWKNGLQHRPEGPRRGPMAPDSCDGGGGEAPKKISRLKCFQTPAEFLNSELRVVTSNAAKPTGEWDHLYFEAVAKVRVQIGRAHV